MVLFFHSQTRRHVIICYFIPIFQSKIFEFVKHETPQKIKVETVQTIQSNDETDDESSSELDDDDEDETPCKMPRLDPFVVSREDTNPSYCDEASILSEPDCFKPELIRTERDSENIADASGDHVLIDDDDDLPEL